jgi:hypothetical protein
MGLFDGYQRGAEAAKADSGENKAVKRVLEEFARNGFGLIPGAQNREDEFRRGYTETYDTLTRDAQRNVPVHDTTGASPLPTQSASSPQTTQGNSAPMATNQTVEQQIELLKEMGRYIWELKNALETASNTYDKQMKGMEGRGMDATVTQFYTVHVVPLQKHLQLTQDGLKDEALPSLKKLIQYLENLPPVT